MICHDYRQSSLKYDCIVTYLREFLMDRDWVVSLTLLLQAVLFS